MSPRPNPRRLAWRSLRPPPYDVKVSQSPRIEEPTEREIAIRRRIGELWANHPELFFDVVRDADRRQREDGLDQPSALEASLDAVDSREDEVAQDDPYPTEPR